MSAPHAVTDRHILQNLLVVVPAFNEEASLGGLLLEIGSSLPKEHVLVVSDGSKDRTIDVARAAGVRVLDLPHNMGVGGAVQAGFQYAVRNGFGYVLRLDGDGQHPPAEALKLIARMAENGADLVVGSRFGATRECVSSRFRYAGIRTLALFLSLICRARISDPTSGFWLVSRPLLDYFARYYPSDYPEPEALALMRRQGYSFAEAPVLFRGRQAGQSSIGFVDALYYVIKVGLALLVDRVREVNPRFAKSRFEGDGP
jgi:glycosyltransferase involved in cell wall biosynthesis